MGYPLGALSHPLQTCFELHKNAAVLYKVVATLVYHIFLNTSLKTITFLLTPLYFVLSGYITNNLSLIRYTGVSGYDWAASASSKVNSDFVLSAYDLNFTITGVGPSSGPNNRWRGHPLRCKNYS